MGVFTADGYTTDEVDFEWNPFKDALKLKGDISLAEFLITDASAESCGKKKFSTGKYNLPIYL